MTFLFNKIIKKRKRRARKINLDYKNNKELARELVHQKLNYWNQFYNLKWNRISIRDTKTRWGSCSSKQNLNFNYRIIHLPDNLADYLIVHEMCHLLEMNHSHRFWDHVAKKIPDYEYLRSQLKRITIK